MGGKGRYELLLLPKNNQIQEWNNNKTNASEQDIDNKLW